VQLENNGVKASLYLKNIFSNEVLNKNSEKQKNNSQKDIRKTSVITPMTVGTS
jgi:hypothetical protein